MKKGIIFTFLIFSLGTIVLSQSITQVIKGRVIDKQSEMPLIGATVILMDVVPPQGTTTDAEGNFRLKEVPLGRQNIQLRYLGYKSMTIPNIVVTAGKEVILEAALEESIAQLDAVVITSEIDKDKTQNEFATVSARTFSLEEVNRFSGGRSDVGRLVTNFAGVSTADDSRNDIVIRGNSPTGVLWRMEGIPIPNPNHFSTLGTTGGPVSALNPNILRNSDFMTSAFPAEYGNATAGVFDLGMRSGNKDKHEFMLQTGVISGLELMAEGPLSKEKSSSYLIAGRYSFIGLASNLGLSIGTNAVPDYSDLAIKLDFARGKAGKFTLFGIGGRSDINFWGSEVDENDLFAAPDEDAFASSRFGVVGLKHNLLIGKDAYLRTIVSTAYSGNGFEQIRYFNQDSPDAFTAPYASIDDSEVRFSVSSYFNKKFNAKLTTRIGVLSETYKYDLSSKDAEVGMDSDGDGANELVTLYKFNDNMTLIQPFAQAQYRLNDSWTLNAGLHAQYLTLNETFALEPRLALNWQAAPKHAFNLGYGIHQQTQPLPILLAESLDAENNLVRTNEKLDFTRSQHFVLGYDYRMAQDWRLKAEVYYQLIDQVPVETRPNSFSLLNSGADFTFPRDRFNLVNEGTGFNRGIELTLEKFFSKGYYGLLTASVYDSKYKGSDGIERNTAFNNTYVLNILAGKEFTFGKNKRNAFTLDTKLTTAGGRYYTPVDPEASKQAGFQIEQEELAFSKRHDPYFRWDVKFGFQFNSKKRKLSHRFYFDLQNVLNNENIFARRYNRQTASVNEVYQLGFWPDFMYRIQF